MLPKTEREMLRLALLVSALCSVQTTSEAHRIRVDKRIKLPRMTYEPCRGQEAGKFVKDRYACDKFFYCGPNHVAISVDCPHGMIFNDKKEICDFPWNYNCIAEKREPDSVMAPATSSTTTTTTKRRTTKSTGRPPTTRPTSTVSRTSTVSPTSSVSPTSIVSPAPTRNRCPATDSSRLTFLQDKTDCHRYYVCYHGRPMALECIQELHWNPRLERCDFPESAGCSFTATTAVMPPLRTTVSVVKTAANCPNREEQVLPHPEECNYFIYCVNGFPTVQQCPFFHHFDVQSKSCMWQTVARCRVNRKP